jgi:hypothetical protein
MRGTNEEEEEASLPSDSITMAGSLRSLSIHWSKRGSQMRETRKKE